MLLPLDRPGKPGRVQIAQRPELRLPKLVEIKLPAFFISEYGHISEEGGKAFYKS